MRNWSMLITKMLSENSTRQTITVNRNVWSMKNRKWRELTGGGKKRRELRRPDHARRWPLFSPYYYGCVIYYIRAVKRKNFGNTGAGDWEKKKNTFGFRERGGVWVVVIMCSEWKGEYFGKSWKSLPNCFMWAEVWQYWSWISLGLEFGLSISLRFAIS